MQLSRIRLGIAAGLVASAATTGVLLGFGIRQGMPARPFNIAASVVLGDAAAGSWGFHQFATPLGVVLHVAAVVALGVVAALIAGRRSVRSAMVTSVTVSAVAGIVHLVMAARSSNVGRALTLSQLIVVYLFIAAGLVVGMRLARTPQRTG